jgi:hypothetical protein
MADASLPSYRFPLGLAGERSERRKVRKGTSSCWECKRRKIRCTFAAPRDVTCDGCKRRGIICTSQEFPCVVIPTSTSGTSSARQVGDRLGRVEALVEQLVTTYHLYRDQTCKTYKTSSDPQVATVLVPTAGFPHVVCRPQALVSLEFLSPSTTIQ